MPPINQDGRRIVTVAPSDLTFLLNECPRCLYRKVILGLLRPSTPMPRIFSDLDRLQRAFHHNMPISNIDPGLPDGNIQCMTRPVMSAPIPMPGTSVSLRFRGTTDAELMFDDRNDMGIVDFKTTRPSDPHVERYTHQLHAYALAYERPDFGSAVTRKVSTLGLLCFEPTSMEELTDGRRAYIIDSTWLPVPRDDAAFFDYLGEAASFLEQDTPPPAGPNCKFCSDTDLTGKHTIASADEHAEVKVAKFDLSHFETLKAHKGW